MRLLGYELTIEVARTDDVDERYRSTDTMAQVEIAAAPLVIHPIVMSEPHAIDATFGAVTTISDCVGTGVATAVGVGGCGVGTELGTIDGWSSIDVYYTRERSLLKLTQLRRDESTASFRLALGRSRTYTRL